MGQLQDIADLNCITYGLHIYLIRHHALLFKQEEAQNKDYAVAFYDSQGAGQFLEQFHNGKKDLPKPTVEFFGKKKKALNLLAQNCFTALSWRFSPSLELMY